MKTPPIVSPQAGEAARQELLVKEKALTRARDALAAERRRMPWLAVDKTYGFEGPEGLCGLLDGGRPGRGPAHLQARDTTLVFASRAPQAQIQALQQRHGWEHIPWYTITDDFDADFDVDQWHGTNAFIREGDRVFRTYLINARGDEQLGGPGTIWT
jgi:predicted dithiol-disulfide oxidoreductase (DUF899 family)